jgi:predicted nucleic acid-binding protein
MLLGEARAAARDWVREHVAGERWFRGAYLAGSTITQPDDAALAVGSDLDVVVVTDGPEPLKPGKLLHRGALPEVTLFSRDQEREGRLAHLQQAKADLDALTFGAASACAFGRVAVSLRRAGRKPQARAYDALIAATALAHDLPDNTCNPADFDGIDGLDVIAVPPP